MARVVSRASELPRPQVGKKDIRQVLLPRRSGRAWPGSRDFYNSPGRQRARLALPPCLFAQSIASSACVHYTPPPPAPAIRMRTARHMCPRAHTFVHTVARGAAIYIRVPRTHAQERSRTFQRYYSSDWHCCSCGSPRCR